MGEEKCHKPGNKKKGQASLDKASCLIKNQYKTKRRNEKKGCHEWQNMLVGNGGYLRREGR